MKLLRQLAPWLVAVLLVSLSALALRAEGRAWVCACPHVRAWTSGAWTYETSQQLFDPYSLTHLLHGFAFCGLLALAAPRAPARWRLCLAILMESLWEVVENTDAVIARYREATAALGYAGDTVVNSIGDIVACGVGFVVARRLGWRRTLAAFALVELILICWIRDSLLLNVLMLLHWSEAIRAWQAGH